jgi:alanyl-tRNA synthetase
MTSSEIKKRFLNFFRDRKHTILPSASLVPQNDPSVLFNTAGMQPLVPYLLGEPHPNGTRLASSQKCVRTVDIDEVGDNTHLTFFEMLGNWSLGDYWKKEAIEWSYEFLTSAKEGLGLNPERLYVTCFEGDSNAPRDIESAEIWREIFEKNKVKGERIYFRPAEKNWWSAGENGPCGPDTEMFYDLSGALTSGMTLPEYIKADEEQKVVEIWNDVFMEYLKKEGKVIGKLDTRNIDTGSGFERLVAAVQGKSNVFDTDIFSPTMTYIRDHIIHENISSERILADHLRTAVFMISDGVIPANTDRGYILRRLLRRAVRHADILSLKPNLEKKLSRLSAIASLFIDEYTEFYPELKIKMNDIFSVIEKEEEQFLKTLGSGQKHFEKIILAKENAYSKKIDGEEAFGLFSTYGFPLELTVEMAREKGFIVDEEGFNSHFKKHQDISRAGSEKKFKGGLAGGGEMETKYHTATHLLHQALRDVLGNSVEQKGSNITEERLRFDFAFTRKITEEEKKMVEDIVNSKIKDALPVNKIKMKKEEAEKTGALHFFGEKYGDEVDVYFVGDSLESAYSKEFCGGPHVSNTSELGRFRIVKEEAVASGVRRIKAVLE